MFSALLILLLLPITDVSRSRGMQFRPFSKVFYYVFIANFLILMQLGAKHVESPFIEFGQLSTVLYFFYFSVIMYSVSVIENSFSDLHNIKKSINNIKIPNLTSTIKLSSMLSFNNLIKKCVFFLTLLISVLLFTALLVSIYFIVNFIQVMYLLPKNTLSLGFTSSDSFNDLVYFLYCCIEQ
jgi:ubiquinol-cytochrome c reductase cytochrome b subunit